MTIPHQEQNVGAWLAGMAREMRAVMTAGHMDHFNTLSKQRNHVLQWLAGMTPAPALNIAPRWEHPAQPQCAALFRQAIEENQGLTQHARLCMAETRKKLEALNRRRQSQNKLSEGYSAHAQSVGLSTRM